MFACDVPLTPDEGEAQSWLSEELSRAVYQTDSRPVLDFVTTVLERIGEAFSYRGSGSVPLSLVLMILAIIAIAVIAIALILNPIRLAKRASHSVFEEEITTQDIRRKEPIMNPP